MTNTAMVTSGPGAMTTGSTNMMGGIIPRNLEEMERLREHVERLSHTVAKAGLYGVKSQEDAFVRMATGMELGLTPFQSLRGVFVISGKPGISSNVKVALCRRAPACEYFELVESTKELATWKTKRKGQQEQTKTFTIQEARAAGLFKNSLWETYPAQMLQWRCASFLADAHYADVLFGMRSADELIDLEPNGAPGVTITPDGEIVVTGGPTVPPAAPKPTEPPKGLSPEEQEHRVADLAIALNQARSTAKLRAWIGEATRAIGAGEITQDQFDAELRPAYEAAKGEMDRALEERRKQAAAVQGGNGG